MNTYDVAKCDIAKRGAAQAITLFYQTAVTGQDAAKRYNRFTMFGGRK